jgi:hypothetical protein
LHNKKFGRIMLPCSTCKRTLSLSEFDLDKRGLPKTVCRQCSKEPIWEGPAVTRRRHPACAQIQRRKFNRGGLVMAKDNPLARLPKAELLDRLLELHKWHDRVWRNAIVQIEGLKAERDLWRKLWTDRRLESMREAAESMPEVTDDHG